MSEPSAAAPPPAPPPTEAPRTGSPGTVALGAILIVLGGVFFAAQQFSVDLREVGWPLYVIGPGLALIAFGLTGGRGPGLTVAGSIVTMVGLVLFYQNATDRFESWAYAWALVGPGGNGLGLLLHGARTGDRRLARDGFWSAVAGIVLFGLGYVFFEGVIGLSGEPWPFPGWVMPAIIIALGLLVLVRGVAPRRRDVEAPMTPMAGEPPPPPPPPPPPAPAEPEAARPENQA